MITKLLFFVLFLLNPSNRILANNFIQDEIKRMNEGAKVLKSPAVSTLWGGYRRFKLFNHNQGEIVDFHSPLYKTGKLKIYFRQTNSDEIVVFMPGIFGSIEKGLTPQMIDQIEKTNVNLLVLPNMLSQEHIEAQPQYSNDPLLTEVLIHEAALDKIIKVLNRKNIKIHIVAESLGSIIGSAWANYDQSHRKRLSSLTLLWPPLELPLAMKNFDQVVTDHKEASKRCGPIKKAWLLFSELYLNEFPSNLSIENEKCLGSIVLIDGFMSKASQSWESYAKVSGQSSNLSPHSFEDFFRSYRKEIWNLIEQKHESTKLETWLKNINGPFKNSITIFTSQNDFLNSGIDLEKFKMNIGLKNEQFIVFPWGGHSGPMGIDNFYKIIEYYSPAL